MSPFRNYVLIFVLALAISSIISVAGNKVEIINLLGDGNELKIHCRSATVDRGDQVIRDNGRYSWEFGLNIGTHVVYNCDMSCGRLHLSGHFMVFAEGRDSMRCGKDQICHWLVKRDGLYLYTTDKNFFEKQYSW